MATISMIFIIVFILAQCALGIMLLYRGFTLILEQFDRDSWRGRLDRLMVAGAQMRAMITWKRIALALALLAPGALPILLIIAIGRSLRRIETGDWWRWSTRWLKTAIQNIAL